MSKIFSLYRNELLKCFKRTSVLVIAIIMAALIILFSLGIKLVFNLSTDYAEDANSVSEMKADAQEYLDSTLADLEERGADLSIDGADRDLAVSETSDVIYYNYLEEYGVSSDYRNDLIRTLSGLEADAQYPYEGAEDNSELISRLSRMLENGDYGDYLDYQVDEFEKTSVFTNEQTEIIEDSYKLLLKVDPDGESYKEYYPSAWQLIQNKLALLEIDGGDRYSVYSSPMSEEEEQKLRDDTLLLEYKFENGALTDDTSEDSVRIISDVLTFSVGLTMVIILMIILAGGSVSSEMSTGSIKSLIIAPVKRWKIFTAKLAALITVSIAAMIFMFLVRMISGALIFGASEASPYLYVSGGEVRSLGYFIFNFLSSMVDYLNVLVFVFFAFMLSVITRNTGASVGISIGMYFGIMELSEFVSLVSSAEWTHFLPSMNLSLSSRVFTESPLSSLIGAVSPISYPSVGFSLIYLAVASLMMVYTAFDSFTRRDI